MGRIATDLARPEFTEGRYVMLTASVISISPVSCQRGTILKLIKVQFVCTPFKMDEDKSWKGESQASDHETKLALETVLRVQPVLDHLLQAV